MVIKRLPLLFSVLLFFSCGNGNNNNNSNSDAVQNESSSDFVSYVAEVYEVTNSINVFDTLSVPENSEMQLSSTPDITSQVPLSINQDQYTKPSPKKIPPKKRSYTKKSSTFVSGLRVIQQKVYIKVGTDRSNISVSTNKVQKITAAVFTKPGAVSIDIYIYAIPIETPLVRNKNTLLGFIKNMDVINNQAQFTKYWSAKRVDSRPFAPGFYNIYIQYYVKDRQGNIIEVTGRYWGGNHRNWLIEVL
ncbi:MAG: hypothetical protein ACRCTQ_03065 [Brevinemataceae bacterium]